MILVDKNIRERVLEHEKFKDKYINNQSKPLIEGFKEENLQSASYDVTITNKIKVFTNAIQTISLIDENLKETIKQSSSEIDITHGYKLRPGEFVRVQLNEYINIPKDLIAHVRPRTTLTRLGLILSAQHINPTYNGRLSLGLYNTSTYIIELIPNLTIGQLVFEQLLDIPEENKLYANNNKSKYQNEDSFVDSKIHEELKKKTDIEYEKFMNKLMNEEV